jgi:hypothetical protein
MIRSGLLAGVMLFAAGEIPVAGDFQPFANLGAVGVLGWVAWKLFCELKSTREESQKRLDTICQQFDIRDAQNRAALEKVSDALGALRENCASKRKDSQ